MHPQSRLDLIGIVWCSDDMVWYEVAVWYGVAVWYEVALWRGLVLTCI